MRQSRGQQNISWIEQYCVTPSGPEKGQRARLTTEQRHVVRTIYDGGNDHRDRFPVTQPLAAYLTLLHVCGFEAVRSDAQRHFATDLFTLWNATGPDLRAVLKRDGAAVVCPELGTRYPAAA